VGEAVSGVAVPVPGAAEAADAGSPVDGELTAHGGWRTEADGTVGGDLVADCSGTPRLDPLAADGDQTGEADRVAVDADGPTDADPAVDTGGCDDPGLTAEAGLPADADWFAGDGGCDDPGWSTDAGGLDGPGLAIDGDGVDESAEAGWASDVWGAVWPLGGRVRSEVPAPYATEPDRPAEVRGDLTALPPGPALASALAARCPSEVSTAGLVDVIVGCERLARWADAVAAGAVAELSRRPVYHPAHARDEADELRSAGGEVALALSMAPATGEDRVVTARRLVEEFPATLAALRNGDVDSRRAKLITDVADRAGLPVAGRVEARVLPQAGRRTLGQHRRAVERAILAVDPAAAEHRHARAAAGRRVAFYPLEDDMAALTAELTADGLAAVRAVLDAAAASMKQHPGETRSTDQLRADALVELARASLASGRLGGIAGVASGWAPRRAAGRTSTSPSPTPP
jgi:hypothetical protein